MFGLWRKIEARGSVAIPVRAEALSRLEWVEVAERYPELVPENSLRHDIYGDLQLLNHSPFVRVGDVYKFMARNPESKCSLDVFVNTRELLAMLVAKDYWSESFASGVLTCSCGIPDCDGIDSQSAHVSERMVLWDVCRYGRLCEFFFEREAYDQGVVQMLHELCRCDSGIDFAAGGGYERQDYLIDGVRDLLVRHPYYADIWMEHGFPVLM